MTVFESTFWLIFYFIIICLFQAIWKAIWGIFIKIVIKMCGKVEIFLFESWKRVKMFFEVVSACLRGITYEWRVRFRGLQQFIAQGMRELKRGWTVRWLMIKVSWLISVIGSWRWLRILFDDWINIDGFHFDFGLV